MNKLNMAAFVNYMPEHRSGGINIKMVGYRHVYQLKTLSKKKPFAHLVCRCYLCTLSTGVANSFDKLWPSQTAGVGMSFSGKDFRKCFLLHFLVCCAACKLLNFIL